MKPDIKSRADVIIFVDQFYRKVSDDILIGPIFGLVAQINWEEHLPRMYDFWENNLFATGSYKGTPMQDHISLHEKFPLKKIHFERWLKLFNETIDQNFEGTMAHTAKVRALSIATSVQIRLGSLS